MVKTVWTELTIEDLRSIHSYISHDSKFYADRFLETIISRTAQLEYHPMSGRIVPEFRNETLRERIEGNYRIIYKMNSDFVAIVRVHHSAQPLKGL